MPQITSGVQDPNFSYPNNLMAPLTPKTIRLRTKSSHYEEFVARVAGIMPGMVLAVQADGYVSPHPVAGGAAERLIAVEDALQGKTIRDVYTQGDPVLCWIALEGDDFYLYVAAGATAIRAGDGLTSDGAGGVKLATGSNYIIAVAQVALPSPAAQTWVLARAFG